MIMRSLLVGVSLLAISGIAATAADLRRPLPYAAPAAPYMPYFTWTGFYIGANGGYGWGESRWNFPGGTTGDFNVSGGAIGVTAGYNYQIGPTVLGVEADIDWTNIRGNTNANCGPTCFTNNTWLTTVRGLRDRSAIAVCHWRSRDRERQGASRHPRGTKRRAARLDRRCGRGIRLL